MNFNSFFSPSKYLLRLGLILSRFIRNDKLYLKYIYFAKTYKILDLNNPVTFNEKLQWLKLNCKNDEYSFDVDKYEVKNRVAKKIGQEYLIPTYGVWDSFDEIDFKLLPDKFVLKCTHDSGGIILCTDKSKFDVVEAKRKLDFYMNRQYFLLWREYPYKNVPHRIIAEEYLVDESGWQLKDYKIFCFNGEPKFIEVDYDRYVGHKLNVYDLEWKFIDFYMTSPNDPSVKIPKPNKLAEMITLARQLAEGSIFVRVDFYCVKDQVLFGELTYHPGSGMIDFHPKKYDRILGDMLKLPARC